MMKNVLFITLVFAAAGAGYADTYFQDTGDHLWSNPANWDLGIPDPCVVGRVTEDSTLGKYCLIDGGTNSANSLFIGANTYMNSKVVMTDGDLTIPGRLVLSGVKLSDYSVFDMQGGYVDIAGAIQLGYHPTKTNLRSQICDLYLRGGTMEALNLQMGTGAKITMEEGATLLLEFDRTAELNSLIRDTGQIVSPFGTRTLWILDYNTLTPGYTTLQAASDLLRAWNPFPVHQATQVSMNTELSWSPGDQAVDHRLFLGTDYTLVLNGDSSTDRGLVTSPCNPGPLELGQTYFWRVDGINDPNSWTGHIWQFTTANYIMVENFETYIAENLENTWKDGSTNGTGASVALESTAINVQEGTQSLKFSYANSESSYSEISRTFATSQNWDAAGVQALFLTLHGAADNNEAPVYLILKDEFGNEAQVNYTPAADLIQREWQEFIEWNIDLQSFRDAGVITQFIKSIYIGTGDRQNATGIATGDIYIDNLRLYGPRYLAELFPEDIVPNGVVDLADAAAIAADWLLTEKTITAQAPNDSQLRVHYAFEDESGLLVTDSTANGFTGLNSDGTNHFDASGVTGGCIAFNGTFGVIVPAAVFDSSLANELTISLWIKTEKGTYPVYDWSAAPYLFQGGTWATHQYLAAFCPTPVMAPNNPANRTPHIIFRAAAVGNETTEDAFWPDVAPQDWGDGEWVHLAFVKNATEGTNKIYRNGVLVAENTNAYSQLNVSGLATEGFRIGQLTSNSGGFEGKMDEFRLYTYALTQPEVVSLAQQTNVVQPILSNSDVDASGQIDYMDFSHMGELWMMNLVWPY